MGEISFWRTYHLAFNTALFRYNVDIACYTYIHVCIDMGDTDSVFAEYDKTLSKNVSSANLFGLLDASSLLWRLNVMGIDVGEKRWSKVTNALEEHAHNHRSPWLVMLGGGGAH